MRTHVFRLSPDQELREQIQRFAKDNAIQAGYILTCVAGLRSAKLRMAGARLDKQIVREWSEHLEVVSLVGTVEESSCHLHIAIADADGVVYGGHLKEAIVFPTAEVVIGQDESRTFTRERDDETGFNELVVRDLG